MRIDFDPQAFNVSMTRRSVVAASAVLLASSMAQAQVNEPLIRRAWPAGKPIPELSLKDTQGKEWNLRELKGRPVLINFWATWCEPCRSEMPSLELAAQRFESDGLVVLAVDFRETDAAVNRFLSQYPISLPVLRDRDGAAARAWGVRIFPTTVMVDRLGQVRAIVNGEVDWTSATAKSWIAELL